MKKQLHVKLLNWLKSGKHTSRQYHETSRWFCGTLRRSRFAIQHWQCQITHFNFPYLLLNLPSLHNDLLGGTVTVGCVLLHSASVPTLNKAHLSPCSWQGKKKTCGNCPKAEKLASSDGSWKANHLLPVKWHLGHSHTVRAAASPRTYLLHDTVLSFINKAGIFI